MGQASMSGGIGRVCPQNDKIAVSTIPSNTPI